MSASEVFLRSRYINCLIIIIIIRGWSSDPGANPGNCLFLECSLRVCFTVLFHVCLCCVLFLYFISVLPHNDVIEKD